MYKEKIRIDLRERLFLIHLDVEGLFEILECWVLVRFEVQIPIKEQSLVVLY